MKGEKREAQRETNYDRRREEVQKDENRTQNIGVGGKERRRSMMQ